MLTFSIIIKLIERSNIDTILLNNLLTFPDLFMTLALLKSTGQFFFFPLNFSQMFSFFFFQCFFMRILMLAFFWQKYYGVLWNSYKISNSIPAKFHHILAKNTSAMNVRSTVISLYFITDDTNIEYLFKVVSVMFFHYKLLIFLF